MTNLRKVKADLEANRRRAFQHLRVLRAEIGRIDEELHWLEHAPLCVDDAIAEVDRLFSENKECAGIDHFFYRKKLEGPDVFGARVALDRECVILPEAGSIVGGGSVDLAGLLIPLFGDTLRRTLHDLVRRAAKNVEAGPPLAERPQLKKELEKRRHDLEVEEESLICAAEELGMDGFYRRADCNPEIVLLIPDGGAHVASTRNP